MDQQDESPQAPKKLVGAFHDYQLLREEPAEFDWSSLREEDSGKGDAGSL